jgi:hypothetical protein
MTARKPVDAQALADRIVDEHLLPSLSDLGVAEQDICDAGGAGLLDKLEAQCRRDVKRPAGQAEGDPKAQAAFVLGIAIGKRLAGGAR